MTIAYGISPGQIKAIHALVGRLGWDDDLYRAMLKERCGVCTCKALSHARAALLIDELKAKVSPSTGSWRTAISPAQPVTARRAHTWPSPGPSTGSGRTEITPKQQALIDHLFGRLGWDQRRRDGFFRKVIGRVWPQDNREVARLLKVLRPMVERYPGGYDRAQREG